MNGATITKRVAVRCRHCGVSDLVEWVVLAHDADPATDRAIAIEHWLASHRGGCSARWASQPVDRDLLVGPLGPYLVERSRSTDWLAGGAT